VKNLSKKAKELAELIKKSRESSISVVDNGAFDYSKRREIYEVIFEKIDDDGIEKYLFSIKHVKKPVIGKNIVYIDKIKIPVDDIPDPGLYSKELLINYKAVWC
jgi:hypothetical protein